jgi:trehalose 6-phosphate synthase
LILVSNRGPIEWSFDERGHVREIPSAGGVAVSLAAVAANEAVTWIIGSTNAAERLIAKTLKYAPFGLSRLSLVDLPETVRVPFYNVVCNQALWFLQHSLGPALLDEGASKHLVKAWQQGYVAANRRFADAVIRELDAADDIGQVMLHDYHLYLAPRMVRSEHPGAAFQHFVHVPWPEPSAWSVLPDWMVRQICDGLLANDSVVFQTELNVAHFLATCQRYLNTDVDIIERRCEVRYQGRTVTVWSNPISTDVDELHELAGTPAVAMHQQRLQGSGAEATIVRVDRLDPSKNVLRGFQAYELLLRSSEALRGRVRFLAFLIPSRVGVPQYDGYATEVFDCVDRINRTYGNASWTPVQLFYGHDREQALAALRIYDVLLVNSIADGMNLVSKEGAALNQRDGAMVLSMSLGSYPELAEGAIGVDPLDVQWTAAALEQALRLSARERAGRAARMKDAVKAHELRDWWRSQLRDLEIKCDVKALTAASL